MDRNGGRKTGWLWVVLCGACTAALAAWLVKRGQDVLDSASLLIALPALFGTLGAAYMALVTLRVQPPDTAALAALLARQVKIAETRERTRLLGDVSKPIDVGFTLRPAPAHNADGANPQGSLTGVVDYYRRLRPGRLVITGAPGSGKTVLAIELLLALIKNRRERDPVPVRMSLASWTRMPTAAATPHDIGDAVRLWMRQHLMDTFQLSRVAATALVEDGLILPILDGLDEMDPGDGDTPRARRAMQELDAYRDGTDRASMILTSRSAAYNALGTHARDTARVEITPVSAARARAFIRAHIDDPTRWRDVLRELSTAPTGPLAQGLSTPWRLTMAVTLYEQRDPTTGNHSHDPADLLAPSLTTPDAVRDHLVELFLQHAATGHPPPPGRMTPRQVHARLHVLARYLEDNMSGARIIRGRTLSGIDLIPHELWPLAGNRRIRAAQVLLHLVIAIVMISIILWHLGSYHWITWDSSSWSHELFREDISQTRLFFVFLGTVAPIVLLGMLRSWFGVWPSPHRLTSPHLRTRRDRRRASIALAAGATAGYLAVVAVGAIFVIAVTTDGFAQFWDESRRFTQTPEGDYVTEYRRRYQWRQMWKQVEAVAPSLGVTVGIPAGIFFGLVAGVFRSRVSEVGDPRRLVRDDFVVTLTTALTIGFSVCLSLKFGDWIDPERATTNATSWLGAVAAVAVALASASVGVRYVVFLMFTRLGPRRLPWRLGRFLHWATQAGIMRTAGTAYQFRHRELQDWLAHRPAP
jgi:hypothetical protein